MDTDTIKRQHRAGTLSTAQAVEVCIDAANYYEDMQNSEKAIEYLSLVAYFEGNPVDEVVLVEGKVNGLWSLESTRQGVIFQAICLPQGFPSLAAAHHAMVANFVNEHYEPTYGASLLIVHVDKNTFAVVERNPNGHGK